LMTFSLKNMRFLKSSMTNSQYLFSFKFVIDI
jgi:hypothetical protein